MSDETLEQRLDRIERNIGVLITEQARIEKKIDDLAEPYRTDVLEARLKSLETNVNKSFEDVGSDMTQAFDHIKRLDANETTMATAHNALAKQVEVIGDQVASHIADETLGRGFSGPSDRPDPGGVA